MYFENSHRRSRENSVERRKLTTQGTGKLHIGNLPLEVQEQDIKDEFERYKIFKPTGCSDKLWTCG
jgi:hypothetical protein